MRFIVLMNAYTSAPVILNVELIAGLIPTGGEELDSEKDYTKICAAGLECTVEGNGFTVLKDMAEALAGPKSACPELSYFIPDRVLEAVEEQGFKPPRTQDPRSN